MKQNHIHYTLVTIGTTFLCKKKKEKKIESCQFVGFSDLICPPLNTPKNCTFWIC